MRLIAHRGNIYGRSEQENMPEYIEECLSQGYDAEIDVWFTEKGYFLGHDEPLYPVSEDFLETSGLWCHAKNKNALENMLKNSNIHCFWHESDNYTLTSKGKVWIFPNTNPVEGGYLVLVDREKPPQLPLGGVCSDFVGELSS